MSFSNLFTQKAFFFSLNTFLIQKCWIRKRLSLELNKDYSQMKNATLAVYTFYTDVPIRICYVSKQLYTVCQAKVLDRQKHYLILYLAPL